MKPVLRFLCFAVDFIVVMFPVQIVLFGFAGMPMDAGLAPTMFFMVAFTVYNVTFVHYMGGQTPGKAIGRLRVGAAPQEGTEKPDLPALLLRESLKSLYFFPIAGHLAGLASAALVCFGKGSLHDYAGRTAVFFHRKEC